MKQKTIFKLIALLVASVLMLSLVACGNNNTNSKEETTPATSQSSSTSESSVEIEKTYDPLEKYEPAIELTAVHFTDTNMKFPEGQSWEKNDWTDEIEKVLGIKIKYLWTTDIQQYDNKLNVTIASGELPDFFRCNPSTLSNLVRADSTSDLKDVYEKYGSPKLKQAMDDFKLGFESGIYDGKLLGISQQGFAPVSNSSLLWIRDDWMQKFSIQPPKTFDDVLKIAEIFTKQDPDGNGKADTYGLGLAGALVNQGFGGADGVFNAYHAYPSLWLKDSSGQIVYGGIQPEVKLALQALQNMYKNGLLDKEFGVKDGNKIADDVNKEKIGLMYGQNWLSWYPFADLAKSKKITWSAYNLVSSDDKPVLYPGEWPVGQYFVVSKQCKYPEALVKMMNLFIERTSSEVPGDSEKFDESSEYGARFQLSPVQITNPKELFEWQKDLSTAFEAKDSSVLVNKMYKEGTEEALKFILNNDYAAWPGYYQCVKGGPIDILGNVQENGQVMITEFRGKQTETMAKKMSTLDKLRDTAYIEIIIGGSIDKFDAFVSDWKKLAGDQITKEMNDR